MNAEVAYGHCIERGKVFVNGVGASLVVNMRGRKNCNWDVIWPADERPTNFDTTIYELLQYIDKHGFFERSGFPADVLIADVIDADALVVHKPPVVAKPRKLKTKWSLDAGFNLRSLHGMK